MNSAIKAFGKSILVVLWFYICSFVISNSVALFCGNEMAYVQFIKEHANLVNIGVYLLIFLGVFLMDRERQMFINSFKQLHLKNIVSYLLMGLGAYIIGLIITNLLIGFFPEYHEIENSFNQYEPVLRFFAMVILPAITEEYLFRYKIQSYLKEGFGKTIAIIGQALLFGMLHYYTVQKVYAFVLGLLFGYLKEKKGTIQCSIWMHMTVNGLGWLAGCLLMR